VQPNTCSPRKHQEVHSRTAAYFPRPRNHLRFSEKPLAPLCRYMWDCAVDAASSYSITQRRRLRAEPVSVFQALASRDRCWSLLPEDMSIHLERPASPSPGNINVGLGAIRELHRQRHLCRSQHKGNGLISDIPATLTSQPSDQPMT